MSPTSRHGDPAMFMVSVDQRLLIDRQEGEWKRKLEIRYWSHTGGMCGRPVAACAQLATERNQEAFPGRDLGLSGVCRPLALCVARRSGRPAPSGSSGSVQMFRRAQTRMARCPSIRRMNPASRCVLRLGGPCSPACTDHAYGGCRPPPCFCCSPPRCRRPVTTARSPPSGRGTAARPSPWRARGDAVRSSPSRNPNRNLRHRRPHRLPPLPHRPHRPHRLHRHLRHLRRLRQLRHLCLHPHPQNRIRSPRHRGPPCAPHRRPRHPSHFPPTRNRRARHHGPGRHWSHSPF